MVRILKHGLEHADVAMLKLMKFQKEILPALWLMDIVRSRLDAMAAVYISESSSTLERILMIPKTCPKGFEYEISN